MKKTFWGIGIIIVIILCSCNNRSNTNTTEEPNVSVNDSIIEEKEEEKKIETTEPTISADAKSIALYEYFFEEEGLGRISYSLDLFDDNSAVYAPCYDDCGYVGKYGYKEDSLIFTGVATSYSDYVEPDKREKIRVAFLRKDGNLIHKDRVYINSYKPTMYEVVQMLTGRTFIGKKDNYYFTYDFTYNVLDENDNAMFTCRYEEFELNSNYGTTPMEILKQSANSARFLKSEKLMVTVMKKELNENTIMVRRNRMTDIMPRFEFWITGIERDYEGNLEQAKIDAEALGVRLNGIRK